MLKKHNFSRFLILKIPLMRKIYSFIFLIGFLLPIAGFSQSISGKILDQNNITLPGASVVIEGTTQGATSDMDGNFTIKSVQPGEYILNVNFLGFKASKLSVTVEPGKNTNIGNVTLAEDAELLEEVVIVGYGVQRQRDVTGTISKIEGSVVTDLPVPSFNAALQGQAAGVQVTTGSGLSGSSSVVRVRGIASISAGGDPLYVVDGIPISQDVFLNGNSGGMNSNPLSFLNPNDIESIEILKDAASTGIYGSRGANGVILITTKRGKTDKLKLDFVANAGISLPTALPDMLNNDEFLQLYQEAWENDGNVGPAKLPSNISWEDARKTNTDWVDETIGVGFKQNYSLSGSRSINKLNYYLNGSYENNESFLIGNSYERISGRANLDYKVTDDLKIGVNTNFTRAVNDRIDAAWSGGLGAAMSTALPIYPIYDTAGEFTQLSNPVRDREYKDWITTEYRSLTNLTADYKINDNFSARATGNFEYVDIRDDQFEDGRINPVDVSPGVARRGNNWVTNYNYNAVLNYTNTLNEDHRIGGMIGYEYQYFNRKWRNDEYLQSVDRRDNDYSTDSTEYRRGVTGIEEYSFRSVFARGNYVLKGKYIAQGTFRMDGSSKFGPESRYGYFPSASLGWVVTEESFMKGLEALNFLKAKVSFGLTGNANIPNNVWRQTWGVSAEANPDDGYNGKDITYPTNLENPGLKWETAQTFDLGLEFGLLEDRIHGELTFYNKKSNGVLMNLQVPRVYGFYSYWDNVGEIINRGIEFSIKSRNLVGEFKWTTDFNIANNYNEIVSIGDYSEDAVSGGTNDTRAVVGSPVGTNFLVRYVGVDPMDGRPIYLDIDGNQTKDWDPADRVAVGDVLPDVVGGLTNSFSYKAWDLSVLLYYSIGGKIYDSSSKRQMGVVTDWNMRTGVYDRWQEPGDLAKYPRLTLDNATYGSATPWINTDLWLHDASYVRLRRVGIGYTFQESQLMGSVFSRVRFGISGTNLFTWTQFPGLDPEIARDFENNADRNMSVGITYLTPPQEKTYNIHVTLSF